MNRTFEIVLNGFVVIAAWTAQIVAYYIGFKKGKKMAKRENRSNTKCDDKKGHNL